MIGMKAVTSAVAVDGTLAAYAAQAATSGRRSTLRFEDPRVQALREHGPVLREILERLDVRTGK